MMSFDPQHDELEVMKDETRWSRARVSDFLELSTTSRMANAAPMWAYALLRHSTFAVMRALNPAARRLSAWNRQNIAGEPLRADQVSVPTKSARLCHAVARGKAEVVIAKTVKFSGLSAMFADAVYAGNSDRLHDEPRAVNVSDIDVALLCTGYRTEFSWLEAPGLEWNPRTWFKHCFPKGYGDKIMFLGWARPHQGGIPACAEILARYIAMILDGTRELPADYSERAMNEGRDEHEFYLREQHAPNVVDLPAFMDSVARLIGCLPEPPRISQPERLLQYWVYPNWPLWYRKNGPGARPDLVESVLSRFPVRTSLSLDPYIVSAFMFSLLQAPIGVLLPRRSGLRGPWALKAKKYILHDNA